MVGYQGKAVGAKLVKPVTIDTEALPLYLV